MYLGDIFGSLPCLLPNGFPTGFLETCYSVLMGVFVELLTSAAC